jgi:hypothetical protein
MKLQTLRSISWLALTVLSLTFFTSSTLRAEAEEARAKALRAEAEKLMEKARDLKAEGSYEESERLAAKAKELRAEAGGSKGEGKPERKKLKE